MRSIATRRRGVGESPAHVLIVDDDPLIRESLREWLERDGHVAFEATDGISALELLDDQVFDVLLLDLALPRVSGVEVLRQIRERRLDIRVIVVSGQGTIPRAVETIKLGAVDFIEKPPDAQRTLSLVQGAIRRVRDGRRRKRSLAEAMERYEMVGASPAMQRVYRQIDRAAPTRARVLIVGESGTGKERVAQSIHRLSNRKSGPLVSINCAAIPESMIEDELFGHVSHAFTDAKRARKGCFASADGGTLFLDEISEMSLMTQAKLLRAVESNEILPVGSDRPTTVDVRVVCATNRSLSEEIDRGNFREDLFYRLNVIPIHLPRLAERGEDLLPLIDHFLRRAVKENSTGPKSLTSSATGELLAYEWPGNVRELQFVMERLAIMGSDMEIRAQDVTRALSRDARPSPSPTRPLDLREARERFERAHLTRVLHEHDWRIQESAAALGINRSHLWKKMRALRIQPPSNASD